MHVCPCFYFGITTDEVITEQIPNSHHLRVKNLKKFALCPEVLTIVGLTRSPMLVYGGDKSLFGGGYHVVDYIAGCWWADIIIKAPCQIGWTLDKSSEVHNIIICHGCHLLRSINPFVARKVVWVASRTPRFVSCHITHCGVVSDASGHTSIKSCRNQRQSSTLTSALRYHVATVPLGK